jgi:hypothetical protein
LAAPEFKSLSIFGDRQRKASPPASLYGRLGTWKQELDPADELRQLPPWTTSSSSLPPGTATQLLKELSYTLSSTVMNNLKEVF